MRLQVRATKNQKKLTLKKVCSHRDKTAQKMAQWTDDNIKPINSASSFLIFKVQSKTEVCNAGQRTLTEIQILAQC